MDVAVTVWRILLHLVAKPEQALAVAGALSAAPALPALLAASRDDRGVALLPRVVSRWSALALRVAATSSSSVPPLLLFCKTHLLP